MRISPNCHYPWWIRLIFWAQTKKYGRVLEPTRLWGMSPKVMLGLQALYRALDRKNSPIEPSLRSLITVRVSQINHCAFCIDINASLLEKQGISPEKIAAITQHHHHPLFSEREHLALCYAEAMTVTQQGVDDQLFAQLSQQFAANEIIELTALISYQNLSSKFNAALDVPAQGFCSVPTIREQARIFPKPPP